jgi:hypothetical protein
MLERLVRHSRPLAHGHTIARAVTAYTNYQNTKTKTNIPTLTLMFPRSKISEASQNMNTDTDTDTDTDTIFPTLTLMFPRSKISRLVCRSRLELSPPTVALTSQPSSKTSISPRNYVNKRDAEVGRCQRRVVGLRVREKRDPAGLHRPTILKLLHMRKS